MSEVVHLVEGAVSEPNAIRLLEVELSATLPELCLTQPGSGCCYTQARVLARLHGEPLGIVDVVSDEPRVPSTTYAPQIWGALANAINHHLVRDGQPPVEGLDSAGLATNGTLACEEARAQFLSSAPFASVVVPTHDRPAELDRCVQSLLAQHYPAFEIIVVDNHPSTDATERLVAERYADEPRVRYVCDPRAGGSLARNHGLLLATAEYVAFSDDDVVHDPNWLLCLMRGFATGRNVACVTGSILPMELETPAQIWIEQYGGFHKGFEPRLYDLREHRVAHPLYPYTAGAFGSGASMAFRADALRQLGGFDEALGPATPARGGEDLAAMFDVVASGYQLAYAPGAIVYHPHRREYAALKNQLYGYGMGLTAYLTRTLVERPVRSLEVLAKVPYGLYFTLSPHSKKNVKKAVDYPTELSKIELRGMLAGPWGYLRGRLGWTR